MIGVTTLLVDFGDVLFTWHSMEKRSAQILRSMFSTATWFDYEKGLVTEDQMYTLMANELGDGYNADTIKEVISMGRSAVTINTSLADSLNILKKSQRYQLCAMSNISKPDFEFVQSHFGSVIDPLFEYIFPSYAYHDRKPSLSFFRRVLEEMNVSADQTLFIDDKIDNVLAAQSLGMKAFLFNKKETEKNIQLLVNRCVKDPCIMGEAYLRKNAGKHYTVDSLHSKFIDNYTQLLMLDVTQDKSLVQLGDKEIYLNFFQDPSLKSTVPNDIATTSLNLILSEFVSKTAVDSVLDEILRKCVNDDGIIQCYFDIHRPRIDPIVCIHAMTLFHKYGRADHVQLTEQWIMDVLIHRAYENGTRYHSTPECFLYFFARLMAHVPRIYGQMRDIFTERVDERLARDTADPLAIAMRLLAAKTVGLTTSRTSRVKIDLEQLESLQEADGSWVRGIFWTYGEKRASAWNDGLTTALAVQAIRVHRNQEPKPANDILLLSALGAGVLIFLFFCSR